MELKFSPQTVSLDTQIFEQYNYHYDSNSFGTLVKLSKQGKVNLVMTSVSVQEIEIRISLGAKLTHDSISSYVNTVLNDTSKKFEKARISQHSFLVKKFKDSLKKSIPDYKSIKSELLEQFHLFLDDASVEVINADTISISDVFSKCFSENAPFSAKKKYEFPDAFTLLALQKYSKEKGTTIYIISSNSNWKQFCSASESLIFSEKLDKFLETMSERIHGIDVRAIKDLYEKKREEVEEGVADCFPELPFEIVRDGDRWDETIDRVELSSEVISINVQSVQIKESSLIDIEYLEESLISVSFVSDFDVDYTAEYTYGSAEFEEDETWYGGQHTPVDCGRQFTSLNVSVTLILSRKSQTSPWSGVKIDSIDISDSATKIVINLDRGHIYY